MSVQHLQIKSTPYTYILEWTKQGKRYIGARWAKGCHPSDLWAKYFTSSEYVREFGAVHGAPDIISIDQIFGTPQEAMAREQKLQYQYNVRQNDAFLNKAVGGVWDHLDPDIVERHRASHIGHKHTDEHKAKIGDAHRGLKRSSETGKKISAAKKGKKQSAEHTEKHRQAMIGKKHSDETKRLMSQQRMGNKSRKGQAASDETKLKMSLVRKGKKFPIVNCPHCHKSGGVTGMKSRHFDRCKSLKG